VCAAPNPSNLPGIEALLAGNLRNVRRPGRPLWTAGHVPDGLWGGRRRMGLRFTVLASGSGGNASLVEADGFTVLLGAGLGPRQLASRMAAIGASWASVGAVLLTHTHSDHWRDRTLAYLHRHRIPLYCHPGHHPGLLAYSAVFPQFRDAGLVRPYQPAEEILLAPSLRCRALPVSHDVG